MSTKKLFTPEEVEILKENPYTWKVPMGFGKTLAQRVLRIHNHRCVSGHDDPRKEWVNLICP